MFNAAGVHFSSNAAEAIERESKPTGLESMNSGAVQIAYPMGRPRFLSGCVALTP
jgi:hypothetical protein